MHIPYNEMPDSIKKSMTEDEFNKAKIDDHIIFYQLYDHNNDDEDDEDSTYIKGLNSRYNLLLSTNDRCLNDNVPEWITNYFHSKDTKFSYGEAEESIFEVYRLKPKCEDVNSCFKDISDQSAKLIKAASGISSKGLSLQEYSKKLKKAAGIDDDAEILDSEIEEDMARHGIIAIPANLFN